jgi:hypothetical protein
MKSAAGAVLLLLIAGFHPWIGVSHPVIDQDLPRLTPLQHSLSESPEHIEPRVPPTA